METGQKAFFPASGNRIKAISIVVALLLCCTLNLFGEGTKEILVRTDLTFDTTKCSFNATTKALVTPVNMFQIWDQGPSPGGIGRASGTYTSILPANEKMRIKIRVCKVGEVINIGFNPSNNNLMYWRLYRPDGTCVRFNGVAGATNLSAIAGTETVSGTTYTYRVPRSSESTQPGYIRYFSQAAVGPAPATVVAAAGGLGVGYPAGTYTGYAPIQYVVTAADMALAGPGGFVDFFIAMNGDHPTNEQKTVNRHLAMFDVTVWDAMVVAPTQPTVRKARLFSAAWDIQCNGTSDPANTFNARLYFYSTDSVVTSVTFNRMRPHGFIICANQTGCANTGNTDNDRRSRIRFNGAPEYPIFLNNPYPATAADQTCGIIPKSSFGNILSANVTGCDNDRCINIMVDKTGTVGVSLLPTGTSNFVPRIFNNQTVNANTNTCIPWDGLDGAGNPIVNATLQINYFNGLTNLPLYDVEFHQYGYRIDLIAPNPTVIAPPGATIKPILVYWDDRPPVGENVLDFTQGNALDGYWDHDNNALTPPKRVGYTSNEEVIFPPTLSDTTNQSHSTYNLTGCDPTLDHNNAAGVQNVGCHLWNNRGANSNCNTVSPNCAETHNTWWNANVIEIPITYITSNVKVYADQDAAPAPVGTGNTSSRVKNVCSTVNPIPINGVIKRDPNVTNVTDANDISDDVDYTGTWSLVPGSADGSLQLAANQLVNGYIPTASDLARGYVLLRIASDINAALVPCGSAADTLRINLFQGPQLWGRQTVDVCANNATVQLDPGIVGDSSGVNSIVTSYRWTPINVATGLPLAGGTFVPNDQSLGTLATYTPPASFTSGQITMRIAPLTTTVPPTVTCPAPTAQFTINVNTVPLVNVVDNVQICKAVSGATTVPVTAGQATINGGTSLVGFTVNWTGSGSFTGNGTLTPTYTPTASELSAGTAKIVLNVTKTSAPSCGPVRDTMTIAFINRPTANAGGASSVCSNNITTIPLNGVAANAGTVSWSVAAPGTGSFSPTNNDTTVFTPSGTIPSSYTFTMTVDPVVGSPCPAATGQVLVNVTNPSTVTLPAVDYYCMDNPVVSISATVTGGGNGEWFGNSAGTTKPPGTITPSDQQPNITYTLSTGEIGNPIPLFYFLDATATCSRVWDTIVLFPAPTPTLSLPASLSICENALNVPITGTFISGAYDAASLTWSTLGTGGTFNNTNIENPTYTPSASDRSNGSVKLVLSVSGIAPPSCAPVTDTITINFTPAPTVDAGSDRNVCSNNPTTPIAGTVNPAATPVQWTYVSGPNGTISSATSLNATFTATGTPAAGSTTVLQLTATAGGTCQPVSSTMNITYTAPPTAVITTAAGSVCANNAAIIVRGSTSTGSGTWTSSSGCSSCFVDANRVGLTPAVDSTVYNPSPTDILNQSVTFILQTGDNGNCNTVNSSSVTINITPAPTVTATVNNVCESSPNMTVTGTSSTGTGTWSSSSGCVSCFSAPNSLTSTYTPSVNDITNGTVSFTFTSSTNGNCVAVQANATSTIQRMPTVDAGPDLTVCATQNTVALTGTSATNTTASTTYNWSVKAGAGSGTFTNGTSLTGAIYNPSADDKANGTAIVVITLTEPGCGTVTQERILIFTTSPTAAVGPDQTVCQNDANPLILDASGTPGGSWSCAGCMATIGNAGSLTANYTPAAGDINQTRTFTYSVAGGGGCPGSSASLDVSFLPAPVVTITAPATHCGNSMTISLTGTTSTSGLIWTSSGNGTFSNQTGTSTDYQIAPADTVGTNSTITFTLISTGSSPCSPDSATASVTITDPIFLFTGADRNICATTGTNITLAPAILTGGATTVTWSIVGASTGTLTANPPQQATYTIGAGDGGTSVTFQGITNAVGPCAAITDQMIYTFVAPVTSTVTAPPAGFCQTGSVTLSGVITNANTGYWTCTNCSGTGTFSPDRTYNNLIPQTSVTYTPAPADTSKASLSFQLSSDSSNVCGTANSAVVIVPLEKNPRVSPLTDRVLCANNNVITLPAATITHTGTGVWHAAINKTTGFSPSNGFPAATTYDPDTTEVQNGFVTLTLISTGSTFCPSDSAKFTVTFSESPVANAGLDRTICKNNPTIGLVGSVNPSTGFTTQWTSPNCGTTCFSSPTTLLTDYTLSYPTDTLGTSLMLFLTATDPTGLCAPDRDTVLINLTTPPSVNITSTFPNPICNDSLYIDLAGTSTGGYNWSSTGTGTFQANAFQPTVVYPFTAADRAKASLPAPNNVIRIYLSSDNGFCLPVRDSVDVTLAPAPIVTITTGDSSTICANINTVNLSASVDQAGFNIDWTTSGNGTFSPDAPTVPAFNTTYTLGTLDRPAGSIVLMARTVNPIGSSCRQATKQYKLNITPLPVIVPGANYTVCQTTTSLDLSDASVTNASSATWTTSGSGVFGPNNTTVGAGSVYYPTYLLPAGTNDVDQASITLTLTAVGCSTMTATRTINFTPKPSADAGSPQTVCNEATNVSVTGTPTNANGVSWRVAGSATTFATTSNATYSLTAADKTTGFVDLVYTVNGMGSCSPVMDTVRITIRPQPFIEIGPGASFCATTTLETLGYFFPTITLTNGLTPTWTSTGTGTLDVFDPLTPSYMISAGDINNGSVTIRATTRSHASCMIVSDAMSINISKAPTLELGPDMHVCAVNGNLIQLNSATTNASGTPSWSSDKSGFFIDPNAEDPIYDADPSEETAGQITTIYAIVAGNGSCAPARDSLRIIFEGAPVLEDLDDTVICFTSGVPFNYFVSTGILGDWTSSNGAATFSPDGTDEQSVTLNAPTVAGSFTITFDPDDDACFAAQTATATITLVEAPTVTVTSPADACINDLGTNVAITSTPANNGGIQWTTIQGFGTINSATTANPTYTLNPDSSDFALDSIMLKVTVQGTNPSCAPVEDTVVIRPHQAPRLSVVNQLVCDDIAGDANAVTLNGTVTGTGHTGITWTMGANITGIASPTAIATTATASGFPASVTLTANGLHASCLPVSTVLNITAQTAPTFTSPGADIQACANGDAVNLNLASMNPSVPGGVWSKRNASAGGSFTPNNTGATGVSYTPSTADIALGNIDLIYTITDTGVCYKGYADTVNVLFNTPVRVQTTTPTFTFCAQDNNVNLTSNITPVVPISPPAGPVVTWSIQNGVGVFTSSTNTLNSTYDPNPSDIPNGGDVANGGAILMVKLTNVTGCPDDSDLVSLLLVPEPAAIVNAGSSQQICVDRVSAQLQGLVLNADGGIWRTSKYGNITVPAVAASGTFSDSLSLETDYILSAADRTKPSIRLYLYSNGGNSLCSQVIDSVDITFTPRPVPSATASAASVCADVDSINLTGAFTAMGINGIWSSSGDGYFTNIGEFDPTPVYIPGPTDINVGSVVFTYSSNNFQDCQTYSATDTTIITPKIEVDAGPSLTVCGNNTAGITLTASSPPTNTGFWTPIGTFGTEWGGTFDTLNALQAVYFPADSIDAVVGAIAFRFVSTGGSPCKPDSAQMILHVAPSPTVSIATNTQTVCNDVSSINVNVTNITVATGGFWTTSGTGSFGDPDALNTTYNFSTSDLDSTSITISFITTGNTSDGAQCNATGDAMVITLKPKPVVSALAEYNCITPIGVALDNSSVTYVDPGASGIWTSDSDPSSSGQFSLDRFITSPGGTVTSYFPSASDINRGTVELTLTSVGAGTCLPVSRTVSLNVSTTPIADAGPDLFVCDGDMVSLNATPQTNLVGFDWLNLNDMTTTVSGLNATTGPVTMGTGAILYELTVTDNRGCTNKDTVTANPVADPNISQVAQQCYDFYGYVRATIGGTISPLGTFQWYYNGAVISGENRDSVRITQPGVYHVEYSLGACTQPSTGTTNVLDLPRILTPDYIGCKNSTVTATVQEIPNAQLTGLGLTPYTYDWTPGSASTNNTAVLATSTVNPTIVDTLKYQVTASYTTSLPLTCTYTDTVRVISIPVPDPAIVDSTQVCEGTAVTLDANTPPSNLPALSQFTQIIEWYASGAPATILDNDAVYSPTTSNDYVVRVTIGQCIEDDTARVDFRPYAPKTMASDVKQCFEQIGSYTLDAGPGSAGTPGLTGVAYQWTTGAGDPAPSTSTSQTTVITYPMIKDQEDEEIWAYVTITNQFGTLSCPVTDTVQVRDVCVPRVFPPTVFHPGDGNPIDAEFTIKGKYLSKFKLTVYSRWGEVIFYTEDVNQSWDGTYRGELMPIGVYAYIITYEGKDDLTKGPFRKEGRIVLVR